MRRTSKKGVADGGAVSVGLTEAVEGMEILVCKFDGFQEFRAKRGNYISGGRGFARRISKRESLIIAYLFTYSIYLAWPQRVGY